MTPRPDLDEIISIMLENAYLDFRQTPQYELLKEKQKKMDKDCETMFTKPELDFAEECFETILEIDGSEMEFIYRQGMKDCVKILKKLEIL